MKRKDITHRVSCMVVGSWYLYVHFDYLSVPGQKSLMMTDEEEEEEEEEEENSAIS